MGSVLFNLNMYIIQGFVEQFYCFIKALSFCDHMTDAVRTDTELVNFITRLIVELDFADVRVRRIVIGL